MTTRSLFDPVIDQGIFDANFFEGRLLTAEALRDAQRAQTERQRLLATAVGAGVAQGLRVRLEPARTQGRLQTVTIEKGLAIDGEGNLLRLGQDLTCDVVPPSQTPEAPACLFVRCADAATPQPTVPVGVGLWILVMSPASAYRGRAEKSGLGSEGKIIGCGDRWAVDGVRFRLEALAPDSLASAGPDATASLKALLGDTTTLASRSMLRNLVAHLCLGAPDAAFATDPFARSDGASAVLTHGALDDLRALGRLGGCDVPLALFLWTEGGIAFLDLWSVRRRPVPPPWSVDWPLVAGARLRAEGEARFLQFQAQLGEVIAEAAGAGQPVVAKALFRFLPPCGVLPAAGAGRPTAPGIDAFFAGLKLHPAIFVEGARLGAVLRLALGFAPVDLAAPTSHRPDWTPEVLFLYLVRENQQPVPPATTPPAAPVAVFTSGHVPFCGEARYDANRWSYANYV